MKKSLLIALGIFSALTFCFAADKARKPSAVSYTVRELPTASGADFLEPRKINNRGEVLGKLDFSSGPFLDSAHAGFFSGGSTLDLHPAVPGAPTNASRLPIALNNRGQAVFYMLGVHPWDETFLYDGNRMIHLNAVFSRNDFEVTALNNHGHIVGCTVVSNNTGEAFLYSRSGFQTLGLLPGVPRSCATSINDRNVIIGWAGEHSDNVDIDYTVLFRRSGVVDLHIPGIATEINDNGDILGTDYLRRHSGQVIPLPFAPHGFNESAHVVGSSLVNNPDSRAMIFLNGQAHDLNDMIPADSGWRLIHANDINDKGQIVGWGRLNDHWAGFILTSKKR
jgi:hypothetical protein